MSISKNDTCSTDPNFRPLYYNETLRAVVQGPTGGGTTGLFGAPTLDTTSLTSTVSALREPNTYAPCHFGANVDVSALADGTAVIIGDYSSAATSPSPSAGVVAIGTAAGLTAKNESVCIGAHSGQVACGLAVTNIGAWSGFSDAAAASSSFGCQAGQTNAGGDSTNLGHAAGNSYAGPASTNVGFGAGGCRAGQNSTNIAYMAGTTGAGIGSTNVGQFAGKTDAGEYSLNLGAFAGCPSNANSIVLNASGKDLPSAATGSLTIAPIRTAPTPLPTEIVQLCYDANTCEIVRAPRLRLKSATVRVGSASHVPATPTGVQMSFPTPLTLEFNIVEDGLVFFSYNFFIQLGVLESDRSKLETALESSSITTVLYVDNTPVGAGDWDLQVGGFFSFVNMLRTSGSVGVPLASGHHTLELRYETSDTATLLQTAPTFFRYGAMANLTAVWNDVDVLP